jgi:RimJ/RimL family protein N-acetyltransferase
MGTPDDTQVTLRPWAAEDLPLLERSNTPEMTSYLGGPESPKEVRERHERYLRLNAAGDAHMFRIDIDDTPAGGIGWWPTDHDGVPAYETGWSVLPEWQGRGVATAALRRLIRLVAADGGRDLLVAYPGVDNGASNALCARTGFAHTGSGTEPWRGGELSFNSWVLDMGPLDLSGRQADHVEQFDQDSLDESRWWPYYTPHWSSRAASAARFETGDRGLRLRIDADTPPWSPEFDGKVRASHIQTGQYSGPLGSAIGQHRFRDGLVVREEQPERRLWLAHFGVIDVRMRAITHADAMVAFWPIGFEEHPDDCGEICIAEIFGSELEEKGGWVGVGVKPQRDPRLTLDFEKVWVDGDLTEFHDYAVEWDAERIRFFIDGRWVKTVPQRLDYPVQFMLDVYDLPNESGTRDAAARPFVFEVERVRTFPPR